MLLIQCNQCRAVATTDAGHSPDAAIKCNCCPEDHDHAANANACQGDHDACSTPENCGVFQGAMGDGSCPGGHCGLGVDGCTVCRPITITVLPGDTNLYRAEA